MKRQTKIILIAGIVLVIAIIFFYPRLNLFADKDQPATAGGQAATAGALPVEVVEIKPQRLENNLTVTGNIIPNESVDLRSEISGLVTKITFTEGEFVKKGTPLVYLNDDELIAQKDRLTYTKKLYEGQENRQKQLLEREAISQEEYDIVLNQYNTNLADLNLIEAMLRQTVIRAPFDGVIGLRQISEGSVISPSDVIVTVVNIDPIKIDFSIPERYANIIQQGSRITFTNAAVEGESVGEVYAIAPNIDAATRTLQLRAISPKDRKSTRLNSSHVRISYAVFCLKKKNGATLANQLAARNLSPSSPPSMTFPPPTPQRQPAKPAPLLDQATPQRAPADDDNGVVLLDRVSVGAPVDRTPFFF